jgi:hypothetical protein
MGWVKDGERGYRDGDKRLIKHTRVFRIDLGDPRLFHDSKVSWELGNVSGQPGGDDFKLTPGATNNSRHIRGMGKLDGRIRILEDKDSDWSTIDVSLYRASGGLKTVELQKPDIEVQPQVLWHDAAKDEPKRPPALMLVITLPAESFDLLAHHLESKAAGNVSALVAIDVYENEQDYNWMSAFNYRAYYIETGSRNAAVFEEIRIMPPVGPSPGLRERLLEAADEAIVTYINQYCEEAQIEENRYSQTGSLLSALCRAAAEHDANAGTSVEDFRHRTFSAMKALVDGVRDAATHYSEREKGKLDFWSRPRQPFVEIKRDQKAPYIDRDQLEETADRYLRLPYRSTEFDRLLADMLAAAELYAYGETVIVKNPVAWIFAMSPSPLYPRPIRSWIIGQIWNLVLFGVPIGIAWWLASKQWIDEESALWITFGSGGIFLLLLGISILAMPLFVYRGARERASTLNRLNAMQSAYTAIQQRSLISARHVIHRLEAAADHDVVWPGTLYVLLDDVVARGGRF